MTQLASVRVSEPVIRSSWTSVALFGYRNTVCSCIFLLRQSWRPLLALILLRLFQLRLPQVVHLVGIGVRKDNIKDVVVPVDGVALDILLNVLWERSCQQWTRQEMTYNLHPATRTNRPNYLWGTIFSRTQPASLRPSSPSTHRSSAPCP